MTTLDETIATLPPPWNADVVDVALEVSNNCERVDYWDPRPQAPSRWVPAEWEEDSDGEAWIVEDSRKKTLAEFKLDVAAYRVALAAWEQRRAEGKPLLMTGYVPSGPPTITVKVTRKDGSRATIVGDGETWKVTEVWHGK